MQMKGQHFHPWQRVSHNQNMYVHDNLLKKGDTVSEEAMVIGSPLSLGRKLYTDLQLKYVK